MYRRVLHVFRVMNMGGAETMVMNLYRAMDKRKIQFDFLVHSEQPGYYDNEIKALGGRIYQIPQPSLHSLKAFEKQLFLLLKKNEYRSVHSHVHFFSGFILRVAQKAEVPVRIAHSHTTSDGKKGTIVRQLYRGYTSYLLKKHGTHLVGCSIAANESLFGKNNKTLVLPNGFDIHAYEQHQTQTGPTRTQREDLVIGHIGRFDMVKNHSFFVETFFYFKKKYPNARAILVGDGPEKDRIQALIKAYNLEDSVQLLGIRSNIPELLSQFDLFLFPSLFEGLGNVVIEAQAAGIPCLVSDTVPKEADLSLNLVTFKSLQESAASWAIELTNLAKSEFSPSWNERERKLKENGYDIVENAKYLEKMYMGQ
jgi:glycosyltransferase EpsF